jgi:hypothetical protein
MNGNKGFLVSVKDQVNYIEAMEPNVDRFSIQLSLSRLLEDFWAAQGGEETTVLRDEYLEIRYRLMRLGSDSLLLKEGGRTV